MSAILSKRYGASSQRSDGHIHWTQKDSAHWEGRSRYGDHDIVLRGHSYRVSSSDGVRHRALSTDTLALAKNYAGSFDLLFRMHSERRKRAS